ncbi:hypothetical protein [Corynebacterium pseudopelargi]|uniref:hypothetical protein n=1 Tax=Corynebacterium pseudopelargi TaxID=2080757 RepID=UPI000F515E7F|nr:hypothetical protein [Corynebacterium pseudopelargi]
MSSLSRMLPKVGFDVESDGFVVGVFGGVGDVVAFEPVGDEGVEFGGVVESLGGVCGGVFVAAFCFEVAFGGGFAGALGADSEGFAGGGSVACFCLVFAVGFFGDVDFADGAEGCGGSTPAHCSSSEVPT